MATKYRLHKELGAIYRQSDFHGTYRQWLREVVGYTQGCHGGGDALGRAVGRWRERQVAKEKEGQAAAPTAAAAAAAATRTCSGA